MKRNIFKYLKWIAPIVIGVSLPFWSLNQTNADGLGIKIGSTDVVSMFPQGIYFTLKATGENDITSIAVRFRAGQRTTGAYDYLEFEPGKSVFGELLWRTGTSANYIPPGTMITYNFEIEDSLGNKLETAPAEFIYEDIRFAWKEVQYDSITVAYHGPVKKRADLVLKAILQTIDNMDFLVGNDKLSPIRVTMYNNVAEMLKALPPGSETHRRELITEGQAFTDVGTLLVLGGGRKAEGTASHEITHILTHRAGDSVFRRIPAWLDEGLAEYGNVMPGFSYDVALEFAISNDRLFSITAQTGRPSDPEDVIIFYGAARSIVKYMVARWGEEQISKLMAALKSGTDIDKALLSVYDFDRLGLENEWRQSIEAPIYVKPSRATVRPTSIPIPTLVPYTLASQPMSSDKTNKENKEAKANLNDSPQNNLVPQKDLDEQANSATQERQSLSKDATKEEESSEPGVGGCNAPASVANRSMDISHITLMGGLALLCIRKFL